MWLMTLGRSPSNINGVFALGLFSNSLVFYDYNNGYGFNSVQSSPSVSYGLRTHVAVVRDGDTLTLYINGVFDSLFIGSSVTYLNQDLVLGYDCRDNNGYYVGVMDNINMYNVALSANSIAAIYSSTCRLIALYIFFTTFCVYTFLLMPM